MQALQESKKTSSLDDGVRDIIQRVFVPSNTAVRATSGIHYTDDGSISSKRR
jgi:hypothetical protein